MLLGPYFESFLGLKFEFCFWLVCRSLLILISESKLQRSGLRILGFRKESIAKNNFSQKTFDMHCGVEVCRFCFWGGFGFFVLFVVPENKLKYKWMFSVEKDLDKWICRRQSITDLCPDNG